MQILRTIKDKIRAVQFEFSLPSLAKYIRQMDQKGFPSFDPGPEVCIAASLAWLKNAQDNSSSHDRGFARDYNLINDQWACSYPETTGYIIPTLLECSRIYNDDDLRLRAQRALDWLTEIQMPCGGFQAGTIDAIPKVPVTFNTGQILLGLAAGVSELGDIYRRPLRLAAQWLVDNQDKDGCWRRNQTPFAIPGEKTYETHVAWGLFEADRVEPGCGYGKAGLRQVGWALSQQRDNGWFDNCCLVNPLQPLTHTIGYVLRGIIEAYKWSNEKNILDSALHTADSIMTAIGPDGYLSGKLNHQWHPSSSWCCLTGSSQIALCYFMLYELTDQRDYLNAGKLLTSYVRRTILLEGPNEVKGGVKGSFPVDGDYCSYQYINWAAKFFIDANLMDRRFKLSDSEM